MPMLYSNTVLSSLNARMRLRPLVNASVNITGFQSTVCFGEYMVLKYIADSNLRRSIPLPKSSILTRLRRQNRIRIIPRYIYIPAAWIAPADKFTRCLMLNLTR